MLRRFAYKLKYLNFKQNNIDNNQMKMSKFDLTES